MSFAAMEALKREAERDLSRFRNDLATARREMGDLGPKMEREMRELIRQGISASRSIGQDPSDPYTRRVSLSFEANTDAAKAYVERIPDMVTDAADRLIGRKIKNLDEKMQYYHDHDLDIDTFEGFVRLMTEWKNYASKLEIKVSSAKLTLDTSDSMKEMEKKWKDIAAKKRSTRKNNPPAEKKTVSFGGIGLSGGNMNLDMSSFRNSVNANLSTGRNASADARRIEEQRKAEEEARMRADAERREAERKQRLRQEEERERARFLENCERKTNAFKKEVADLEKKQSEAAKRIRDGISSWQTMMSGFSLFQFAGRRGAREEIEKLESELRMLPGTQRKQMQDKWDGAPSDVREAFLCLDMYSHIQANPNCGIEDAKKHAPKNLGFSSVTLAQKEEALNQLKKAKLIAEICVNGNMVYRAVQKDSSAEDLIESSKRAEQARIEEEARKERERAAAASANASYKCQIVNVLPYFGLGMTSYEILNAMGAPDGLTTQRISALLRQLYLEGLVEKETVDGRTYFRNK